MPWKEPLVPQVVGVELIKNYTLLGRYVLKTGPSSYIYSMYGAKTTYGARLLKVADFTGKSDDQKPDCHKCFRENWFMHTQDV